MTHLRRSCLTAAVLVLSLAPTPARADEAELARQLKEKGATLSETKGVVTSFEALDCTKWADEDFRKIGGLSHLKMLSFGPGLGDASLALLTGLPELEYFSSNLSTLSDEGVKSLARFHALKNVKFFHPGKTFSGAGLSVLAELPNLERLTVAGSLAFNDEGMAAVAKLTRPKEFRTWHAGHTLEGVKHLKSLGALTSLTVGQRLSYTPPTSLSDETLAVLAEMKSLESVRLEEARLNFDSLIRLKELPALKKLVLEGIDLPEPDLERFRKELPKVEIQWTAPNETYRKRIDKLFGPR